MPPDAVVLAPEACEAMVAAARAAWPVEMVGLLGGDNAGGVITARRFEPLPSATTDRDAFAVPAATFAAAEYALRRCGLAWVGFAHSHPDGAAAPSARDRLDLWSGCVQVVVVATPGAPPAIGAFWRDGDGMLPLVLRAASLETR